MSTETETHKGGVPRQSYALLRRILPKALHPLARGLRKRILRENYRSEMPFRVVYSFTQSSMKRQDSLLALTTEIVEKGITGAFVECGVLDGGTAAIAAYAARDDDRELHLFDAWRGLPEAVEKDGESASIWVGDVVGSPARVVRVLKAVGANMDKVVFHRGWFDDTVPAANIDKIAFLHLDADFYEPTRLVLSTFMPRVVSGGAVQIDDYSEFVGCRLAVDEYLAEHPEFELQDDTSPGGATIIRVP